MTAKRIYAVVMRGRIKPPQTDNVNLVSIAKHWHGYDNVSAQKFRFVGVAAPKHSKRVEQILSFLLLEGAADRNIYHGLMFRRGSRVCRLPTLKTIN